MDLPDLRAALTAHRLVAIVRGADPEAAVRTMPALVEESVEPCTDVVEPVGAGDAFAAGFLSGPLRGVDMERALRLGHVTAGSALQVTGDHGPLPGRARIERFLDLPAHERVDMNHE